MAEHDANYEITAFDDSPLRQNSNQSHMALYKCICGVSTTVPFLVFTVTQLVQRSSSFAMHFTVLKLLGFVKCTAAHHWVGRKTSKHYLPLTLRQTSEPVHRDNTIKHNPGTSVSVLSCRGDAKLLGCHSVWF